MCVCLRACVRACVRLSREGVCVYIHMSLCPTDDQMYNRGPRP